MLYMPNTAKIHFTPGYGGDGTNDRGVCLFLYGEKIGNLSHAQAPKGVCRME
jgi:hypothetical protein